MAELAVRVTTVSSIKDHPNADRLSVAQIGGYECVVGRDQYAADDWVVYVPEGAVVPEWMLKKYNFWNAKTDMGGLAGSEGNRVKPLRLRGIYSQGLVLPVIDGDEGFEGLYFEVPNDATHDNGEFVFEGGFEIIPIEMGEDLTDRLGIYKYEPPIPDELKGSVLNLFGTTHGYDFESIQTLTDLFHPDDHVIGTEKLHGFNTQIGYVPGLNNPDCFGVDGNIYISSKGLAAQGLAFKRLNDDGEFNSNIYTDTLQKLLDTGLEPLLKRVANGSPAGPIRIFCEIYGGQDLKYGKNKGDPGLAVFGIYVGDKPTGQWKRFYEMRDLNTFLGLETVPLLYDGLFNLDEIIKVRDGKDMLTGTHIREGVVLTSADPNATHPLHGRKIGKWVSPDYGDRKGGTEFQ